MNVTTMQSRCVWCDGEHHGMNVIGYSNGQLPCGRCGRHSTPMTAAQYRMCRWSAFDTTGRAASPCVECGARPGTLEELIAHLKAEHPPQ